MPGSLTPRHKGTRYVPTSPSVLSDKRSFRASLVLVTPASRFDLSPKSAARPQQSATSLFRAPPGDLVSEKSDMRVTRSYVHTRPEKEMHVALFSATTLIPAFGREPT
eukprot:scaffold66011_cov54-Phaeocystis_antarctica.AAC.4